MAKFLPGDIVTASHGKKMKVVKYNREHDDPREAVVHCEYIPEPGQMLPVDKDGNAVRAGEAFYEQALQKV